MEVLRLKRNNELEHSPFFVNLKGFPIVEYVHKRDEDGTFIHFDQTKKKTREFVDVTIGNKSIKKPKEIYQLVDTNVVTSPTGINPRYRGDIGKDVHSFIKDHVALPNPIDYHIITAYIILTWLYNGFPSVPYLRIYGDYGTGKTTLLNVVSALAYRSMNLSGAVTTAPVFRIIKNVKGTFIIDEADFSL